MNSIISSTIVASLLFTTTTHVNGATTCTNLKASTPSIAFTDVVIFGASYVDNGWHATPFVPAASLLATTDTAGINQATGRNSNGPLFPEVLVAGDGLQAGYLSPVGPGGCTGTLLGPSATLHDFAYSGAACDNTIFGAPAPTAIPFSVKQQVAMQIGNVTNLNQATTLYVFLPATEDIAGQNMNNSTAIGAQVASCYQQQVQTLISSVGARNFLMGNMYPFDKAPQNLGLTAAQRATVANEVNILNSGVAAIPAQIMGSNAGVNVIPVDVHGLYVNTLFQTPTTFYGAKADVTDACSVNEVASTACQAAGVDSFLWWDVHHPTRATHKLLAQAMYSALVDATFSTTIATTTKAGTTGTGSASRVVATTTPKTGTTGTGSSTHVTTTSFAASTSTPSSAINTVVTTTPTNDTSSSGADAASTTPSAKPITNAAGNASQPYFAVLALAVCLSICFNL